jgi:hypothetical protein
MNLKTIIRMYVQRIRPRARAELDWFIQQPTLLAAIENAALARNSRGERYSHQRRIKRAAIQEAFSLLSGASDRIKRTRDFAELFQLISALLEDVPGIGELYVYDTSLRIGAKLNLFPKKVYLHAGTRLGARALGLQAGAMLDVSDLPREFRSLLPHEIEDALCIFKGEFKASAPIGATADLANRSWCGYHHAGSSVSQILPLSPIPPAPAHTCCGRASARL